MLGEFSDLVALKIPTKGGGIQAVRVVWTDSKEDKNLFEVAIKSLFFIAMSGLALSRIINGVLIYRQSFRMLKRNTTRK